MDLLRSYSNVTREAGVAGGRDLETTASGQGGQAQGEELNKREHFEFCGGTFSRLIMLKE